MENKKSYYGLTKGTEHEAMIKMAMDAEIQGTMIYYTLARMAQLQGLPNEVSKAFKDLGDQESVHAGFYATLNGLLEEDLFATITEFEKKEVAAEEMLKPLVGIVKNLGHEDAAKMIEAFGKQETHHGEVLRDIIKKYKK